MGNIASRKRRGTRKSRKASRKSRKGRKQHGGAAMTSLSNAAPLNDTSMEGPSKLSLAQGSDFAEIHKAQHGGAAVILGGAPVGDQGMLDASLRSSARVGDLDASIAEAAKQNDLGQVGGARRHKGRKSRKSRKSKGRKGKSRKGRRGSRRMMYGGAMPSMAPSDYGSPGMLLSADQEARALGGMNPEWKLASNPNSFAPSMN